MGPTLSLGNISKCQISQGANKLVKIKTRNEPKQWKFQLKLLDWFPAFC